MMFLDTINLYHSLNASIISFPYEKTRRIFYIQKGLFHIKVSQSFVGKLLYGTIAKQNQPPFLLKVLFLFCRNQSTFQQFALIDMLIMDCFLLI